jgi:predicted ribosome quality control (RQC) complex YloA/Tae2 family protein
LKTTRSSAAELSLANTELEFENKEKKRRAAELVINNRTCFQNEQRKACRINRQTEFKVKKVKRAAELIAAKEKQSFT